MIHDPEHSEDEDRFVLLGISEMLRVLVIVHVECGRLTGDHLLKG